MSYLCNQYFMKLGLLAVWSFFVTTGVVARDFLQVPNSPLYVVKGGTAELVWTYPEDPHYIRYGILLKIEWFYRNKQSEYIIGREMLYKRVKFQLSNSTCPRRLLSPTVRVSRQDQATLVIKDVTLADSGTYGCRLFSRGMGSDMKTAELVVTESPKFVKPNATTIAFQNGQLRLNCTAVGPPTPNVTWVVMANETVINATQSQGSAVLWIPNVKRSLHGFKYQCQAINNPNEGPVTIATTVVVYYPPKIDESLSSTSITSWEGNYVTLRCKYNSSNPAPTWKWYQPNGQRITVNVHSIADGSEVTVMTGQDSSEYGRYTCVATNAAGSDRHTINIAQIFLPGSPLVFVTDKESTSVTIRWTQPVHNGGNPIKAYRIVIDSKTFHINDTSTMFYTVTDLSPNTQYVVNVSSRNFAGYSNRSSVAFTTRGLERLSSGSTKKVLIGGSAVVVVCATVLVISLMANILLVVYVYRTKRKKKESTEQGSNNKTVQMETVTSSDTHHPSGGHPSVVYEPVEMDYSEQASQNHPDSPRKYVAVPNHRNTIPEQQAIYANTIVENGQPSQDHYQQLNPTTLQHDTTVQYEPLRIKHVTGTDLRDDTYEPLRIGPSEYQNF